VAWLIVTVQVQVVASGCVGNPSPGTIGPLTVITTSHWSVIALTASPSTVSAGLEIVPVRTVSTLGSRVFLGRNDGYLDPPPPHPAMAAIRRTETA
jgi:hypothetical protein